MKKGLIKAVLIFGILLFSLNFIFSSEIITIFSNLILSSSSNSTYTSPQTLTTGERITSSSVSVYNLTWLDFDGVNDYVQLTSDVTNAITFWYKDADYVFDWIFVVNSSGTLYFDNITRSIGVCTGDIGSAICGDINDEGMCGETNGACTWIDNYCENTPGLSACSDFTATGCAWASLYDNLETCFLPVYPVYYNGTDYFIGKTSSTEFFNGSIDDFRIYNTSLSEAEISRLYSGGRQ